MANGYEENMFPVPARLKSHPSPFWANPRSLQHVIKPRPSTKKKLYLTTEKIISFLCVYNWGQPLKDNRRDWSGLVNCLWVCAPCFDSKVEIPCCGPGDESWISWENMTLRLFTLQATVSSSWQMRVNILWGVVLVHREMILVALLQPSFHLTLWGLGWFWSPWGVFTCPDIYAYFSYL